MAEIEKADPRFRTWLVWAMIAAIAIGATLISLLQSQGAGLSEWIVRDPDRRYGRLLLVLAAMAAAIDLPLVGAAAYLWRFGARATRQARFPPEGASVLVDTAVLQGTAAQRRGRILQAVAMALAAAAVGMAVMLLRLAALLERPA